ncbi:hypothetical protein NDU88_004385 [Pleurodeles waltl]|uniref:Uncharacterized protein n=1 Tax=Pleurodeles waltl TaxID=8319 RepID=A0AAV7QEA5_PLEWA|nr:hypothetical protein NDU88_004385 [Pleurodeles waltl]
MGPSPDNLPKYTGFPRQRKMRQPLPEVRELPVAHQGHCLGGVRAATPILCKESWYGHDYAIRKGLNMSGEHQESLVLVLQ